MRKTITICDKCKREIPEGKFVTRPKNITSTVSEGVEDICMNCAYMNYTTIYAGGYYPEVRRY